MREITTQKYQEIHGYTWKWVACDECYIYSKNFSRRFKRGEIITDKMAAMGAVPGPHFKFCQVKKKGNEFYECNPLN